MGLRFPPRPLGAAAPLLCGRQVKRPRPFPARCAEGAAAGPGERGEEGRAGGGVVGEGTTLGGERELHVSEVGAA